MCIYVFAVIYIFLFYLFILVYNNFFKIIINLCFLFNTAWLLSYINGDFFSAFLLVAELPIVMILIIFFFHKNSIQVDSIYKYKKTKNKKVLFIFIFLFLFVFIENKKIDFDFYIFNIFTWYSVSNKNDFFSFFAVSYYLNYVFIIYFAVLIFFISFLVILIYQLNKLKNFVNSQNKKNVIFLRKQNMLKQSVFKSKLKFFSKKQKNLN